MDKELKQRIKSLKQKTFYQPVDLELDNSVDSEDYLIVKGYANKFKDVAGEIIKDSDGDAVVPGGIDLTRYNKNPVVLLNHNRDAIIGSAIKTEVRDDGLYMEMKIYRTLNEKAYQSAKLGVLKSCSIGFSIEDLTYDEKNDIFFLTKTILHENSLVTIPANEDSLLETIDEHLAITGKSLKGMKLETETHQTTSTEVEDLIKEVKSLLSALPTTVEKEDKDSEVPDGADETPPKEEEEEAQGADETEELNLVDEVNSIEVTEETFDDLLQVQDVLNGKLNTFLNETLN